MHIAFVVTTFPSLSHTFIDAQIKGLVEAGHRVTVHAFNRPTQMDAHAYWDQLGGQVDVHYGTYIPITAWKRWFKALVLLPQFRGAPVAYWRSLRHQPSNGFERRLDGTYWLLPLVGAAAADVVICHFGDVALRTMSLWRHGAPRGKLVVFFHGADMTRFIGSHGDAIYSDVFEHADLCLAISERWKSRLEALGCPSRRLAVHRMGVDCSQFEFVQRPAIGDGPIRLISIARLVEKKGIEYAIRALALLPAALRSRIEYRIAGDGPLAEELASLAASLDVEEQVMLLGWQDHTEVRRHVEQAHIMLVPSVTAADGDQEGIPVSAMEAMASGLPVIATAHSGIPELIVDRVNGRLVPERDSRALADAIVEAVTDPDGRWADCAIAARATVVERFNQATLNRELEESLVRLVRAEPAA